MTEIHPSCFDDAPEFIDEDNRKFRTFNPISKSQMLAKHEALLPAELVKGKTVLDFGSCMGTTGHWCLSNGATHYTGVEVQHGYVESSRRLLTKYHAGKFNIEELSLEQWLTVPRTEQYDIVCILGVLYAFSDYFFILKRAAALSREYVAIEALYPDVNSPDRFCGVTFVKNQLINVADNNASVVGRGTHISPKGMVWIMEEFGYSAPEHVILPRRITDAPDIYNQTLGDLSKKRYLMRFQRNIKPAMTITDQLKTGGGRIKKWDEPDKE